MNGDPSPKDFWKRALASIGTAEREVSLNPNDSASSSYYSAFYAISALFAFKGVTFNSHDGVDITFNKDFLKTGIFPKEIGQLYKALRKSRNIGDYMVSREVLPEEAQKDLESAKRIIEAVFNHHPNDLLKPIWLIGNEKK